MDTNGILPAVSQLLLWFANQLSLVTPHSRLFRLRRFAFVLAGAKIHPNAKIAGTVRIHHSNVQIGDSWIGPGTQLMAGPEATIVIGDRCGFAPDVIISCHSHELGNSDRRVGKGITAPIRIGDGTWIGIRATIVYGASVGAGCVVAAGSVVKDEFGDDVIVAGIPARVVRELPRSRGVEPGQTVW